MIACSHVVREYRTVCIFGLVLFCLLIKCMPSVFDRRVSILRQEEEESLCVCNDPGTPIQWSTSPAVASVCMRVRPA